MKRDEEKLVFALILYSEYVKNGEFHSYLCKKLKIFQTGLSKTCTSERADSRCFRRIIVCYDLLDPIPFNNKDLHYYYLYLGFLPIVASLTPGQWLSQK